MKFVNTLEMQATPETLFALTQDYDRRLEWDPFLKSAKLLNDATSPATGVRAYCVAKNGLGMETEYVSYNPPRTCAIKMTRGPRFIAEFAGSWRLEELATGGTHVEFRYHLVAAPKWLSWLLTPVLGRVFANETRKRLVALRELAERSSPSNR